MTKQMQRVMPPLYPTSKENPNLAEEFKAEGRSMGPLAQYLTDRGARNQSACSSSLQASSGADSGGWRKLENPKEVKIQEDYGYNEGGDSVQFQAGQVVRAEYEWKCGEWLWVRSLYPGVSTKGRVKTANTTNSESYQFLVTFERSGPNTAGLVLRKHGPDENGRSWLVVHDVDSAGSVG